MEDYVKNLYDDEEETSAKMTERRMYYEELAKQSQQAGWHEPQMRLSHVLQAICSSVAAYWISRGGTSVAWGTDSLEPSNQIICRDLDPL